MLRFIRGKHSEFSDEELLRRFHDDGNGSWLALLFDRYLELVFGLCLKYLKEESRAEDAVMEIFESLHRKLPDQEVSHFRNWLYSFVRNHCLMALRKENRRPIDSVDPLLVQLPDSEHLLEEAIEANERDLALHDCIGQLNEEQQRCIRLFYLEDHTYKDVARLTQLNLGQVRSHIQNGRRNLKRCMERKARTS